MQSGTTTLAAANASGLAARVPDALSAIADEPPSRRTGHANHATCDAELAVVWSEDATGLPQE